MPQCARIYAQTNTVFFVGASLRLELHSSSLYYQSKLLYNPNEKMHYIRVVQKSKFMFMMANLTFIQQSLTAWEVKPSQRWYNVAQIKLTQAIKNTLNPSHSTARFIRYLQVKCQVREGFEKSNHWKTEFSKIARSPDIFYPNLMIFSYSYNSKCRSATCIRATK